MGRLLHCSTGEMNGRESILLHVMSCHMELELKSDSSRTTVFETAVRLNELACCFLRYPSKPINDFEVAVQLQEKDTKPLKRQNSATETSRSERSI